jgi:TolB protein
MIRRALAAATVALLLAAGSAGAAVPDGPRLTFVKAGARPPGIHLVTTGPKGGRPLRLAGGGRRSRPLVHYFSGLSWSPDGETIAFSGIVGFRDGDGAEPISRLFTVRADGTGRHPIPGTRGATDPVFSPDGRTLAFSRSIDRPEPTVVAGKEWEEGFQGSTLWTIDLASGAQRQLTPWWNGVTYTASSFAPDGSTLLASFEDGRLVQEPQPVTLRLDGSGRDVVFDDGWFPTYSPDGSKIAMSRRIEEYGDDHGEDLDLFVINADGTGLRRLTRTPGRPELFPSWDPSGERLAYVRWPLSRSEDAPFGHGNALMQINADGTCPTVMRAFPRFTIFFAPVWQPGPGRGAGRIEC